MLRIFLSAEMNSCMPTRHQDELREKRQPYGYPTRRFMLEQHMTTLSGSRDGLARYLRDVKEDRDFCTVYSKDFSSHSLVES